MHFKSTLLFWVAVCATNWVFAQGMIKPGAHQTSSFIPLLEGKKIIKHKNERWPETHHVMIWMNKTSVHA